MVGLMLMLGMLLIVVFSIQYMWRFVFNYKITQTGVEVAVFGKMPIMRVPFDDIEEIRRADITDYFVWIGTVGLRNRAFGPTVLIRRRRGILLNVLITPDNADKFVEDVLWRCSR